MRSDKLILAIALTAAMAIAHGATKLTVTADGVNLDGTPLADGKLTENTTVSNLEITGGTLDLNGHTLIYNGYNSKLVVNGDAVITSSHIGETPALCAFRLASGARFSEAHLSHLTFNGNLQLEIAGLTSPGKYLLQSGAADKQNRHTGGTVISRFHYADGELSDLHSESSNFGRFQGADIYGSGVLTLKNGSHLLCSSSADTSHNWEKLVVANDNGNNMRNMLWTGDYAWTYAYPVEIAEGTELVIGTKNTSSVWSGDFSEARGTISLFGGGSGGLQNANANGFPNATIQFLKPRVINDAYCSFVLSFNYDKSYPFEIGTLATEDVISEPMPTLKVCNAISGTRTLKVGGSGADSVFYGNICNNSASALTAFEKVGEGILTLGGTNEYTQTTTLSAGTVKLSGAATLGADTSTSDIIFNGGTLAFANGVAKTDYSKRVKNATENIKVHVDKDMEVKWATTLSSTNAKGLEKYGEGILTLVGEPTYSGTTVVKEGELKLEMASNFAGRAFDTEGDGVLTVVNTTASHLNSICALGEHATVNFDRKSDNCYVWRAGSYPFGGENFKGEFDFRNGDLVATAASGIVYGNAYAGNSNAVWRVTGHASAKNGRLFDIVTQAGSTVYMGTFQQTDPNGAIFIRYRTTIELGAREDVDSIIEGGIALSDSSATLGKIGNGKLTLGRDFRIIAENDLLTATLYTRVTTTNYPALNITAGTFENNADLSKYPSTKITLADNVVLCGAGTWPANMTLPANYHVAAAAPGEAVATLNLDVDFSKASLDNAPTSVAGLNEDTSYTIFMAKSISNWTTKEFPDDGHGKWKIVKHGNSLVLKYSKKAFVVILR